MTKYYYSYNPDTFEYTETHEAYLDPEETKVQGKNIYSLPAWATFEKPPKAKKNEVAIFDSNNTEWIIEPDYRGMYQVNEEMQPEPINSIGELPEGYIAITESQAAKIEEDPLFYIIQDGELIVNPDYAADKLQQAKQNKYNEALNGATDFINFEALYQFDAVNHIEATDGNIAKFTAYALGFSAGTLEYVYWTSKEDNVIQLDANDVQTILTGLGEIQSDVWNIQFVAYKTAIEAATSLQDIERIVIHYVI